MKYQNGLRIYAVIQVKGFEDVEIVVYDLIEYTNKGEEIEAVVGFGFFKETGKLNCIYSLKLPIEYKEVGYVYDHKNRYQLKLERK